MMMMMTTTTPPPPAVASIAAPLRSLDLFSGIGGLTIALDGIAHPVLYCECAREAQSVLLHRMAAGDLPAAPVCKDVRELSRAAFPDVVAPGLVDIVVGGFPCVGFSTAGHLQGFRNASSALFSEILRVADDCQPPLLFLENVPCLVHMGLRVVIDELCARRGYTLRWCVAAAADVGAPHVRRRWFCLAHRGISTTTAAAAAAGDAAGGAVLPAAQAGWDTEPAPETRMVRTGTAGRATGVGLLGNAVVPACARAAFLHLLAPCAGPVRSLATVPGAAVRLGELPDDDADAVVIGGGGDVAAAPLPSCGWAAPRAPLPAVGGGDINGVAVGTLPAPRFELGGMPAHATRTYDPAAFRAPLPPHASMRLPVVPRPVDRAWWPTPRHGNTSGSNYLTKRGLRDLPSAVRFERATADAVRGGQVSPSYVEWIMGYPNGWTNGCVGAQPAGVSDDGLSLRLQSSEASTASAPADTPSASVTASSKSRSSSIPQGGHMSS